MPDAENGLRRGWFADRDDEQASDYGWQPCLETGRGHIPCFEVWFKTKAECEEWIAANVVGVGWLPGDPTESARPFRPLVEAPMGEAPDLREQEDCPSGEVCHWSCDQHETRPIPPATTNEGGAA